jgi:DNA polymerase-3 subunit gamma/tau
MESLYRKYRPQTFDEVVGQQHVVSTLEHAVCEAKINHAYLFCGPRGTGKTTMARLLAKALMCKLGQGHLPDGSCDQCKAIANGEHPDVYELDAASRTGVDNVREEIINRVSFAPVSGQYKVYIIDEVHMLTTAAFNALLKTLEEPPAHVVFILCTTDPQKIPETILSRVQRFDFHAIPKDELVARLVDVCTKEGFSYNQQALELVARHARGGMRDALSVLEQLSVFGDGDISFEAAQDLLGEVAISTLSDVACALATRDVPRLFDEVAKLVDAGRDLLQFSFELAGRLRDIYIVAAVGPKPGIVDAVGNELNEIKNEADLFGSVDRLSRALDILGEAMSEMRTAANQRLVLELALAHIARPGSDLTLEALADRLSILEEQIQSLVAPEHTQHLAVAEPATVKVPNDAFLKGKDPKPLEKSSSVQESKTSLQIEPEQNSPIQTPQESSETSADRSISNASNPDGGRLQRQWRQVVNSLLKTNPARGSLLMDATLESDDGSKLSINLHESSPFTIQMLERKDVAMMVDDAVSSVFGKRHISYKGAKAASIETESAGVSAEKVQQSQLTKAFTVQNTSINKANNSQKSMKAASSIKAGETVLPKKESTEPPRIPKHPDKTQSEQRASMENFDAKDPVSVMAMLTDVFGDGVKPRPSE